MESEGFSQHHAAIQNYNHFYTTRTPPNVFAMKIMLLVAQPGLCLISDNYRRKKFTFAD